MPQPLLEGEYQEPSDEFLDDGMPIKWAALEARVTRLEAKVAEMRESVQREAVVLLLNVLAQAMRDIAAKKYALDGPTIATDTGKWDAVKSRLAPRLRECIDLLLIQKHMKRTQIAAALKMDYSNCTKNVISVLQRQGLLEDNGGELSLKEL